MAVIQYYLSDRQFADLVERAEPLGLSSHQLAKHLALLSEATDSDVMLSMRTNRKKERSNRVKPL